MSQSSPINGMILRQRLLELGISDRAFARATGLGDIALRSILRDNEVHGSVSLATLRRVLIESGLTAAELLDAPVHQPEGDPSDDAAVLAQILVNDNRRHPEDRLTIALGWTLDRLRAAAALLDTHLRPVGLAVHTNNMGTSLRASNGLSTQASEALDRHRDAEDGLDNGTARILYAAYTGTLSSTDVGHGTKPKLAALLNRSLIEEATDGGARFRLTDITKVGLAQSTT
jgi:transcriptional regulator with XRE-family HTH domain